MVDKILKNKPLWKDKPDNWDDVDGKSVDLDQFY